MGNTTRRCYSPEFKQEAIELTSHTGATIAGVARDLGIHANLIWRRPLAFVVARHMGWLGNPIQVARRFGEYNPDKAGGANRY